MEETYLYHQNFLVRQWKSISKYHYDRSDIFHRYWKKIGILLTHQAPTNRWSLISYMMSVRMSGKQKHATMLKRIIQNYMGPGGSLNSQDLFEMDLGYYACVPNLDRDVVNLNVAILWWQSPVIDLRQWTCGKVTVFKPLDLGRICGHIFTPYVICP